METIWKPVLGYEGLYEVSNTGRVRSCPKTISSYGGRRYLKPGRELKQIPDKDGYGRVNLSKNGTAKHNKVHVLVLEALSGPRPDGCVCRHLDGNPKNNNSENLAWGTPSENHRDCYDYGGRHGRGKLNRDQVLEIRSRLANGERQADLAREYGVHAMNIHCIKTRQHFGYIPDC